MRDRQTQNRPEVSTGVSKTSTASVRGPQVSGFLKVPDNRGARLSPETSEWDLSGGLYAYDRGQSQKRKMKLERVGGCEMQNVAGERRRGERRIGGGRTGINRYRPKEEAGSETAGQQAGRGERE